MSDTKKLADMTPEELWPALIRAHNDGSFIVALHVLIQRATEEAVEDYREMAQSREMWRGRVMDARAQLAEAERKLASAADEARRIGRMAIVSPSINPSDFDAFQSALHRIANIATAPTPAASGTPDGVTLFVRRKHNEVVRLEGEVLSIEITPDIARAIVALAREAR